MRADSTKIIRMLKTARGQLDGLIKMVEDDRYCIDISNQVLATTAILRSVNRQIIHAHLGSCVAEAFEHGNTDDKIQEIMSLFDKLTK